MRKQREFQKLFWPKLLTLSCSLRIFYENPSFLILSLVRALLFADPNLFASKLRGNRQIKSFSKAKKLITKLYQGNRQRSITAALIPERTLTAPLAGILPGRVRSARPGWNRNTLYRLMHSENLFLN